ncbi:Uncharacterized protein conserved in bacteria [Lysinibacillus sphaericus]|nr:Uncharacterized protein conserved in bacteria [Lysinibacillus sphaericus]
MVLIDNRNILRIKNRELLNDISKLDDQQSTGQVMIEQAKTGLPTIKIIQDGKTQYLQSKYDPQKEAIRFAEKFSEESIKHVLFVGVGTGLHIEEFMKLHADTKFAIYEPNKEVLHAYLSNFRINELPIRNLITIFTGTEQESILREVRQLLETSNNIIKIATLPVYEKIYGEQIHIILEHALESIKEKHSTLSTNSFFQKRWTINSIKNFPTVLQTPNILHDIDRSAFEGKPAIIVAAGPSLNEEFENLRYIKEHGLAYVFSVGSSINALIEQGIYPDAACTYDPQDINYRVIQKIKDKEIMEIPLVFGSSVGFETIEKYPGKLFHMIVSQDTVSPALLKRSDGCNLAFVNDAPSIAVVTFQLLAKLKVSKIILVGQNLAYFEKRHYAQGINYGNNSNVVSDATLENALTIKDVYGNDIKTTEGFNSMRQQLEMYISMYPNVKVLNTTKGGATIQGTEFKNLENILVDELNTSVIHENWIEATSDYSMDGLELKFQEMERQASILEKSFNQAFITIKNINQEVSLKKKIQLEKKYAQLDSEMEKMKANSFYKTFVEPMVRVQKDRLSQNIQHVRYEKNALKKGEVIVEEFTLFIAECAQNFNLAFQLYREMTTKIEVISK